MWVGQWVSECVYVCVSMCVRTSWCVLPKVPCKLCRSQTIHENDCPTMYWVINQTSSLQLLVLAFKKSRPKRAWRYIQIHTKMQNMHFCFGSNQVSKFNVLLNWDKQGRNFDCGQRMQKKNSSCAAVSGCVGTTAAITICCNNHRCKHESTTLIFREWWSINKQATI